ncbi:DNA polymerase III subunit gamma/tau [Frankia sp. CcI49]|uniref:DNA polymerase III subunit gamma and tau n=1 Tax=Frankia sp. CcI49 TaxID=1745382 RepID=UPI000976F114|nr:DNA polymerase III subunit gamma and tau [Frankia sp. CcI49]ONH52042.1 DNA polymerase III subunit gamma/tau [Frankia sp. CcI49]
MSTALYNRYRPATFGQVVGQEHVTDALGHALRSGRLHHAYLFSGPRGCGKTSSARILAASLNCEKGPTPEPCGVCDQCVSIRTGSSMDVTEIDAASHGLVDDARDLRERAFFAPASARFKVFVVDEAHMVTAAAFNALLKVVEEPPPYLKFVFATTEPDKVIATIRSRTHHYSFRLVPPGVLRGHLESICQQEGVVVDPAVFPLVVRAGAGSVRDSLSVLDQLLAGAGEGGLSYERAVALLGMTDGILLDETMDALAGRDGAALFTVVDRVVSSGHDPRRFATDLLDRLRDLIVVAAVPDAVERGLLESFSSDQVDRMRAQAGRVGPAELSRTADVLHSGLVEMRGTASPRLLLELILARALLPSASADPAALAVRLERLERRPAPALGAAPLAGPAAPAANAHMEAPPHAGPPSPAAVATAQGPAGAVTGPPASGPAPAYPPAPAVAAPAGPAYPAAPARPGPPAPPATPAYPAAPAHAYPAATASSPGSGSGGLDAAGLTAVWDEVLAFAGRRSRRTHAILKDYASVVEVRGDEVVLSFSAPAMGKMFGQGNNAEILASALTDRFGGTWRVTIGGGGPGPSGGRPQAPRGTGGSGGAGQPGGGAPPAGFSPVPPGAYGGSPAPAGPGPYAGSGVSGGSGPRVASAAYGGADAYPGSGAVNGMAGPGMPGGPGVPHDSGPGQRQGVPSVPGAGGPSSDGWSAPGAPAAPAGGSFGSQVAPVAAVASAVATAPPAVSTSPQMSSGVGPGGAGAAVLGSAAAGPPGAFGAYPPADPFTGNGSGGPPPAVRPGTAPGHDVVAGHGGGGAPGPGVAPGPGTTFGPGTTPGPGPGPGTALASPPAGSVPRQDPAQPGGAIPPATGGGRPQSGAAAARAAVMTARAGHAAAGRSPGSSVATAGPAAVGDTSGVDEASLDDEDVPTHPGDARSSEEAAVALLRTSLGATVIDQSG